MERHRQSEMTLARYRSVWKWLALWMQREKVEDVAQWRDVIQFPA
jgi:hypothetical protein